MFDLCNYEHDSDGPRYIGASPEQFDMDDEASILHINDQVYKGGIEPNHKFTSRTRAHGRPPDCISPKFDTSDQHDTSVTSSHVFVPSESETTNVSLERVLLVLPPDAFQFLGLDSSQFTAHYEKTTSAIRGQLELESALLCNRLSRRRLRGGK